MKKKILALSIAMSLLSLGLVGCDQTSNDVGKYDNIVNTQVTSQINKDKQELAKYLADMQKVDPTIKDIYYGYDTNGKKTIHIIKDDGSSSVASSSSTARPASSSTVIQSNNLSGSQTAQTAPHQYHDYAWSMIEGALLYHVFMGGGGFNGLTSRYAPTSQTANLSPDDYRKRKNSSSFAYNSFLMNSYRSSARASSYSSESSGSRGSSSRSSGIFSGGSSARGGSYSSGA